MDSSPLVEQAIRDIIAAKHKIASERREAEAEAQRIKDLSTALLDARAFDGPSDTKDFARQWAPLWMRAAQFVRQVAGLKSIASLDIPDAPGYRLAIEVFDQALGGLAEHELSDLLADRLSRLKKLEGPDLPAYNSRWAFRYVLEILEERLVAELRRPKSVEPVSSTLAVAGESQRSEGGSLEYSESAGTTTSAEVLVKLPPKLATLVTRLQTEPNQSAQVALALLMTPLHLITLRELVTRGITKRKITLITARDIRMRVIRAYVAMKPYLHVRSTKGKELALYLRLPEKH